MKKHRYKLTTKRHILILLCILFLIFTSFIAYDYNSSITNNSLRLDKTMLSTGEFILYRLKTIDRLYSLLETEVDSRMYSSLNKLQEYYEKTGNIPRNLKLYSKKDRDLDIYIIDKNFKVIRSSNRMDLNLDLSKKKVLSKRLASTMRSRKYVSDRINLGIRTGELHKFSYLPSHDGKYIFEAGYNMESYDGLLKNDSIKNFGKDFLKSNPNIKEINILTHNGKCYNNERNLLTENKAPMRYNAHKKAIQTGKEELIQIKDGHNVISYLYFPYKIKNKMGSNLSLGIEINYNNSKIIQQQRDKLAFQSSILFLVLSFLSFIYVYSDTYLFKPLNKILDAIEEVKKNKLDFSVKINVNNEIKIVGDHFNEMLQSLNRSISEKETARNLLEKALNRNREINFEITFALANSIEAKDKYTGGHCERVMTLSLLIADRIGLNEREKEDLQYGSLLHDIGKIGIRDSILNKAGSFTPEEYDEMKKHPSIGYSIVKNIEFMDGVKEIILHHHEKFDGSGYPQGLSGIEIPMAARIVSITDSFDAMTSGRIYRPDRLKVNEAFMEMHRSSGTHFDPELLSTFKKAYFDRYGRDLDRYSEVIEKESTA